MGFVKGVQEWSSGVRCLHLEALVTGSARGCARPGCWPREVQRQGGEFHSVQMHHTVRYVHAEFRRAAGVRGFGATACQINGPVVQRASHAGAKHDALAQGAALVRAAVQQCKYLVRIVYVSTTLGYRVQNDIEVHDATKATIESRFAVVTPPWRARAEMVVFDGLPGGAEPPRELTRGTVTLDGGTSILQIPSREMPALLRRVFEGVGFGDDGGEENSSNDTLSVWSTLEVPHLQLARGQTRVHVDLDGEDRWIDVPMQKDDRTADVTRDKKLDDEPLRIKLWIDSTLRGTRQRMILQNDGVHMVEAVTLNMSNAGDAPREVWLEEHARPAKRRMIERAWPAKPSASGDRIRNKVVVKPGRVERVGYTLVYDL